MQACKCAATSYQARDANVRHCRHTLGGPCSASDVVAAVPFPSSHECGNERRRYSEDASSTLPLACGTLSVGAASPGPMLKMQRTHAAARVHVHAHNTDESAGVPRITRPIVQGKRGCFADGPSFGAPPRGRKYFVTSKRTVAGLTWPVPAGAMPRFPWSVKAENGCNRRVWLICAGLYRSGIHNMKPRIYRGPRFWPQKVAHRPPHTSTGNRGYRVE
jgi:hypothetical protein